MGLTEKGVEKMAEQKKKAGSNPEDYGSMMVTEKKNPSAVEWQNAEEAKIAAATRPEVLAGYVKDAAAAEALLAKIQPAYATNPVTLTVIGAVSQYVMLPKNGKASSCEKACSTPGAAPCPRQIWNLALLAAFRKTKDEYIQTFLLDQFRWCGCKRQLDALKALKTNAFNVDVRKYIDWTASEVEGALLPAK